MRHILRDNVGLLFIIDAHLRRDKVAAQKVTQSAIVVLILSYMRCACHIYSVRRSEDVASQHRDHGLALLDRAKDSNLNCPWLYLQGARCCGRLVHMHVLSEESCWRVVLRTNCTNA